MSSIFGFADWGRRDRAIIDLRAALEFYANAKNYQQRGWQGDPDKSLVEIDNGKIARAALEKRQ